jgi:hypothetical protein
MCILSANFIQLKKIQKVKILKNHFGRLQRSSKVSLENRDAITGSHCALSRWKCVGQQEK